MTEITPLEAVQRIIDTGGDGYQAALSLAMSAEGDMSQRRWLLGDLCLLIQSSYGKNRLGDFATKTNIARSTANQYRNMSAFYRTELRYAFDNLSYSHYRLAYRLKEDAALFLTEASLNQWTIEQTQIEVTKLLGKPLPPLKLLEAVGCIESIDMATGKLTIALAPGVDALQLQGLVNQNVTMKLFELSED